MLDRAARQSHTRRGGALPSASYICSRTAILLTNPGAQPCVWCPSSVDIDKDNEVKTSPAVPLLSIKRGMGPILADFVHAYHGVRVITDPVLVKRNAAVKSDRDLSESKMSCLPEGFRRKNVSGGWLESPKPTTPTGTICRVLGTMEWLRSAGGRGGWHQTPAITGVYPRSAGTTPTYFFDTLPTRLESGE